MRRMHQMWCYKTFDILQIWRHAWPLGTHENELAGNGLGPVSYFVIHEKVLTESQEELVSPWERLYGPFSCAPPDMLHNVLGQFSDTQIAISLHRPAEDSQYQ